jgi:hypothetical protein
LRKPAKDRWFLQLADAVSYNNFFEEYKKIIDKQRGEGRIKGKGIRWIISIDKYFYIQAYK